VRAAEETTADLDSMPDDSALAVLTNRRKSLDRTFEAIERMPCAGSYQLKTLVIVITTNFACCHIDLLHIVLKDLRRDLAALAGTIVEVLTGRSGHRFTCSAIMPPAAPEVDPIAALPARNASFSDAKSAVTAVTQKSEQNKERSNPAQLENRGSRRGEFRPQSNYMGAGSGSGGTTSGVEPGSGSGFTGGTTSGSVPGPGSGSGLGSGSVPGTGGGGVRGGATGISNSFAYPMLYPKLPIPWV